MTSLTRELRHDSPIPERLLWGRLRGGRLKGLKFRRQHPIEPFVVDFYCHQLQLIVELDGLSHLGRQREGRDRQDFLEQQGFRVRYSNDDVIGDPDMVAGAILREAVRLGWQGVPSPSPSRGEGSE